MLRLIVLFCIVLSFTKCDDGQEKQMNSQVIGVSTVHKIKIDKDTIINRNLKLERRGNTAQNKNDNSNRDPDWSYKSIPKEVSQHAMEFKRNMSECLKEVQANDKSPVKRLSPRTESPVHGECLIACVLKRNGVIKDGKVYKGNLIALVSKFYAKEDKLMKKLEKGVDICLNKSIKNKDECALAAELNECTNSIIASNKHKVTVKY